MQDLLTDIFKKHSIWLDIVKSFGCNKDTAEDIVSEMYIKIKKNLDKGLDIHYGDDDYNYFYIFKTLKSLFLDLKRKEKKVDKKIKKRRLKESKEKFSKLSTKNLMAKKDGTYVDKSESKADYIKRRKAQLKK